MAYSRGGGYWNRREHSTAAIPQARGAAVSSLLGPSIAQCLYPTGRSPSLGSSLLSFREHLSALSPVVSEGGRGSARCRGSEYEPDTDVLSTWALSTVPQSDPLSFNVGVNKEPTAWQRETEMSSEQCVSLQPLICTCTYTYVY